jgi:hypothetical protein
MRGHGSPLLNLEKARAGGARGSLFGKSKSSPMLPRLWLRLQQQPALSEPRKAALPQVLAPGQRSPQTGPAVKGTT